jgi:hypothetical protein
MGNSFKRLMAKTSIGFNTGGFLLESIFLSCTGSLTTIGSCETGVVNFQDKSYHRKEE